MMKRAILVAALCLWPLAHSTAQTVIRMWTFLDPAKNTGRELALRSMIESFERANSGVHIRVEPQIFSELMPKFLAGHATGTAPDLIWTNTEQMGALVQSGAAADLEKLIVQTLPKGAAEDFFVRAGWDAGLVEGRRYALPLFHATTSIFYRKDLLTTAGIDPASLRTWDDIAAAAQRLTAAPGPDGRVAVWGFGTPLSTERTGGTTALTTMLWSAGPVWDEGCRPHYATPAGERAVLWHVDMIRARRAMPRESVAYHVDDVADQFVAGRYAMAVMPFARLDQVRAQAPWDGKANLGVLPWPDWTAGRAGPQQVQGWWAAVWARSRNAPEAAAFLAHMISAESVRLWSTQGGQVPTRLSVWNEPAFADASFEPVRAVVEGWRRWSFLVPVGCNTARFDADWNQATQRVLAGATPATALAEAERAFAARQR